MKSYALFLAFASDVQRSFSFFLSFFFPCRRRRVCCYSFTMSHYLEAAKAIFDSAGSFVDGESGNPTYLTTCLGVQ